MPEDPTQLEVTDDETTEFGCWKWIFVGLAILVAFGLAYLVVF